ncbi:peptidylprolyl isomerase [Sphingopyxis flava]|nr:peptidylprolyl isomerase [Sphingopyxis flava]
MKQLLAAAATAFALYSAAHAQDAETPLSPGQIVDAAKAEEWTAIAPSDLLVMDLARDAAGSERRVVIQLMPAPFSQGWIGNIRKLAAAHWWDGASIYRVQDNYVAQWGDADGDDPANAKPLPDALVAAPESEYATTAMSIAQAASADDSADIAAMGADLADERDRLGEIAIGVTRTAAAPQGWHERDPYASWVEFHEGWPLAGGPEEEAGSPMWPVHCYGMVGVARDMSPNTGSGAELYAVIGHAPRHLDRNIALVGRVISGIEHLSSLPRGPAPLGVYNDPAQRVPIISVRLASDLAEAGRPHFEYLSSKSESFARYVAARADRRDPFFIKPAGGVDICNIPVPIRPVAAK